MTDSNNPIQNRGGKQVPFGSTSTGSTSCETGDGSSDTETVPVPESWPLGWEPGEGAGYLGTPAPQPRLVKFNLETLKNGKLVFRAIPKGNIFDSVMVCYRPNKPPARRYKFRPRGLLTPDTKMNLINMVRKELQAQKDKIQREGSNLERF